RHCPRSARRQRRGQPARPGRGPENACRQSEVSSPRERRGRGASRSTAPAPAGALVAVLQRRGRFLVAEPLFPRREVSGPPRRDGSERIVLKSTGSGPAGVRAGAGDLVLVAPPRRGS